MGACISHISRVVALSTANGSSIRRRRSTTGDEALSPKQFHEPPEVVLSQLPSNDVQWFVTDAKRFPTLDDVRATFKAENAGGIPSTALARFPALDLIVKWGTNVTIAEGQCLWFLGKYLAEAVPVPTIYGWHHTDNETFLYMKLVPGETLQERWSTMSAVEKSSICDELRTMASAWRSIKRQTDSSELCQLGGQALRDIMFQDADIYPAGPFPTVSQFHQAFASLAVRHHRSDGDPRLGNEHMTGLDDNVELAFTHGDLDACNIIVSRAEDGPARILAIIDWHQSGWYPKHWERLKAESVAMPGSEWATIYVSSLLPPVDYNYFYSWEYIRMSAM